ncbi:hypothetical protein DAT299_16810 [Streptococcus suis]|nr:hypothetical protein DAT299_16810 [Streptococcus suis]
MILKDISSFFFIEFRDIIDIRYHLESNVHETSLKNKPENTRIFIISVQGKEKKDRTIFYR